MYWAPNTHELPTGFSTPPVLLTNDGNLSFFATQAKKSSSIPLFAKFDSSSGRKAVSVVDDTPPGFTTPRSQSKSHFLQCDGVSASTPRRKGTVFHSGSTAGSKSKPFVQPTQRRGSYWLGRSDTTVTDDAEGFVSHLTPGSKSQPLVLDETLPRTQKMTSLFAEGFVSPTTAASHESVPTKHKRKTLFLDGSPTAVFGEEDAFASGSTLADKFHDGSAPKTQKRKSILQETTTTGQNANGKGKGFAFDLFIDDAQLLEDLEEHESWFADPEDETDCKTGVPTEIDPEDLRPRGYDRDFWAPLVDNDFGGSNAAEVVCNVDDPKPDHATFLPKDQSPVDIKKQVGSSGHGHVPTTPHGQFFMDTPHQPSAANAVHGNADSPTPTPATMMSKRKLHEVDDEEFDLPPVFDDTKYDFDNIPDLDIDDDDRVFEGKAYASKQDCQIALAIYAIKNRFHFKQVRTTRNYFVVQCPDKRCDWRIRANEIGVSGFYEIKKAHLQHNCSIETRNSYRHKASSRVIAAVYRSKYGDPISCPKAAELQQLVLEDLRVSASYMKCYRAKAIAVDDLWGGEDETYQKLPEYLHMLKLANPGTIADIETEKDETGVERFLYLFLSFGASIAGYFMGH